MNQSNNPLEGFRFVGCGVQIEVSYGKGYGSVCLGVEFVFYTEAAIRENDTDGLTNHMNWYEPYIYTYGGWGLNPDTKVTDAIIDVTFALQHNPSILTYAGKLNLSAYPGVSASVCVFAIVGNSLFQSPKDYRGDFDSASGTFHHVKGYVATSSQCVAFGAGVSSQYLGCGYSRTKYDLFGDGELFEGSSGAMSENYRGLANTAKSIAEGLV